MSVKIIAGKFRGRVLKTLPGTQTRPLLARVKKSLFDILVHKIVGSTFLDLFAGFGTVGIEALSRGAKKVVFVENDRNCIKIIEENLEKLGISKNVKVFQKDAIQPDLIECKFDIIFIGPPYNLVSIADIIYKCERIINKNGIVIAQHYFKEMLQDRISNFHLYRRQKYGDMWLSFYLHR
ncbi:MAG: 16S rRNA (guanine(966)-N(2))-methyltransferase RsmD [Elusimicrobiota bacterium]